MTQIRQITKENADDLNLKNESFEMPGKFVPELKDGVWTYHTEPFAAAESMVFPDENYDIDEIAANGIIFGAYEGGKCIDIAIYQEHWLKYMYLYDLKVSACARGKGVGKMLIEAGMESAEAHGYRGIYAIAQDNNLNACMFYLRTGFEIGGFDNRVYKGTNQEGKADVIFYKE